MELVKDEQLYTVIEIAQKIKVSKATVYNLDLPFIRCGKQRRYLLSEVINHLKKQTHA